MALATHRGTGKTGDYRQLEKLFDWGGFSPLCEAVVAHACRGWCFVRHTHGFSDVACLNTNICHVYAGKCAPSIATTTFPVIVHLHELLFPNELPTRFAFEPFALHKKKKERAASSAGTQVLFLFLVVEHPNLRLRPVVGAQTAHFSTAILSDWQQCVANCCKLNEVLWFDVQFQRVGKDALFDVCVGCAWV